MSENKKNSETDWVDPDDAPDLSTPYWVERFRAAPLMHGDLVVRPGRPPSPNRKEAHNIRLDPDIVAYFKKDGPGWQTRLNAALRKVIEQG